MRLSQDETCKFEAKPRQDMQASTLSRYRDIWWN